MKTTLFLAALALLAGAGAPLATAEETTTEDAARACDIQPDDGGVWVICDPGPKMFVCVPPQISGCRS